MTKILIVEDEPDAALVLEKILIQYGFQIVGISTSGLEAIDMAKSRKPDFILMDIKLDGEMDGIEAARYINEKFGINSLFLTGYFNDQLIKRASEMGALGYILKPMSKQQILASVKIAAQLVILKRREEKEHRKALIEGSDNLLPAHLSEKLSSLTTSELRVSALIIQGMSTKQVAEQLKLSIFTIEWHRRNIRKKLGLHKRKEDLMKNLISLINLLY